MGTYRTYENIKAVILDMDGTLLDTVLDMLAAGLFWLFCVLCPQICGQNCTAGLSSAFVRQGMTVRV